MEQGAPNGTNDAAELGTAVHELGEFGLKTGWNAVDALGQVFNGYEVTEEMAEAAQVHINYIRSIMASRPGAILHIEKRVCLSSISEDDLWGTADIIIIDLNRRELLVIDYKNGFGIVEVNKGINVAALNKLLTGNAQCIGYGMAAMDTYNLWGSIDRIITGVVQPNADHIDGHIRTYTYDMDQVNEWWQAYYQTYHLGKQDNAPLMAGKHCRYCKAAGFCKSRIIRNMELLQLENGLDHLLPDQIISLLDEAETIKSSVDLIVAQAVKLARQGKPIHNRKLIKGIRHAKCTDEKALVDAAIEKGVVKYDVDGVQYTKEQLLTSKWTDTQIEALPNDKSKLYGQPKLLGKTKLAQVVGKELANEYFETPESPLKLVPVWAKGTAVSPDKKPDAAKAFEGFTIPTREV